MPTNDFLPYISHHGILGQKWGVRRYQNADGSYTSAGLKRYGIQSNKVNKKLEKYDNKIASATNQKSIDKYTIKSEKLMNKQYGKEKQKVLNKLDKQRGELQRRLNKTNSTKKPITAQELQSSVDKHKQAINNIFNEVKTSGLKISTKAVKRNNRTTYGMKFLFGVGSGAILSRTFGLYTQGTKYKVR